MSLVLGPEAARLAAAPATAVVLVDDDAHFREMLVAELGDHGFEVHAFADGESCLAAFDQGLLAELVLLDWNLKLPGLQGPEILKRLREQDCDRPVIILTGGAPVQRELEALRGGAIDFIDKARGIDVLVPRMRLLVPSGNAAPDAGAADLAPVACGPLLLLPLQARAVWRGHTVELTVAEQRIVGLLVTHGGQPVTYRAIYDQVHYEGFAAGDGERGFERNVRTLIKRLRRKFEAVDPGFRAIRSVTRMGYAWDGP